MVDIPLSSPVLEQVIIEYWEPDNKLQWQTTLQRSEYVLLKSEIDDYNQWINRLDHGKCPLSSYVEEDEVDNLLIAKNKNYHSVFERPGSRGYYYRGTYGFNIYNLTSPDEGDDIDYILNALEKGPLDTVPTQLLIRIITAPYSLYDAFSMGYRVLPLTQKLLTEGRLG